MIRYGFTGTQRGIQVKQSAVAASLLHIFSVSGPHVLNHGKCVGADKQIHEMAWDRGFRIRLYPSNIPAKTAACHGAEWEDSPWPPLERNSHIVENSDRMIATPRSELVERSGTWATISLARRMLRPLVIIYPDGCLLFERWPNTW